jgi:hypothetical protein
VSVRSPNVRGVLPFASLVPSVVMPLSGSVYYSGRDAFTGPSPLYILGLNPGGDPVGSADTVASHLEDAATWPDNASAYRDQSWNGRPPGAATMQPRVLHLLDRLGLDPGDVPSSNLVFARSTREATMQPGLMDVYADACWPFHASVIETLQVRVVLCFGRSAGWKARQQLNAHAEVGRFVETYPKRSWTSRVHASPNGVRVVTATHPSIADWTDPAADVSGLVAAALAGEVHESPIPPSPPGVPTQRREPARPEPTPPPACTNPGCAQVYQVHPGSAGSDGGSTARVQQRREHPAAYLLQLVAHGEVQLVDTRP